MTDQEEVTERIEKERTRLYEMVIGNIYDSLVKEVDRRLEPFINKEKGENNV